MSYKINLPQKKTLIIHSWATDFQGEFAEVPAVLKEDSEGGKVLANITICVYEDGYFYIENLQESDYERLLGVDKNKLWGGEAFSDFLDKTQDAIWEYDI